ncbi:MAG: hypothetical protein ACSLEN_01985 [Candidatus Malihini olakiniferum]
MNEVLPSGGACSRRAALPARGAILLVFLILQAFPNLTVYVNIAHLFYQLGLNDTLLGVVLVHTARSGVYRVDCLSSVCCHQS